MKTKTWLFLGIILLSLQSKSQINKSYFERFLLSSQIKRDEVKNFADTIFSYGKEAIPVLIDVMPRFDRVRIGLVKPIISGIPNYCFQENYTGMRAAYFIEWLLWNKNPHSYDYENYYKTKGIKGLEIIVKDSYEYYKYQYNFIINKENQRFYYADILKVQEIYKNWWEKNKHLSLPEMQNKFDNDSIFKNTPYEWK